MKKLLAIVLAGLLTFGLIGCGERDNNNGDTLTVLLDSSVSVIGFENDIQAGIDEAKASIEDGYTEDTPSARMLIKNSEIIRDWAKNEGISLNCKNWGWADQLTNKLQSAFLAQDTPDIINGETQMPGFAQKGYLQAFPDDLANYIKENCLSVSYSDMTIDGKIYGISLTPSISILVWNKDLLRECGISETIVENGPKSWKDWEDTMKTIKSKGKNAGGVYVGSGNVNYGALLRCGTLMLSGGGGFADQNGAPNVNTLENIEAYEFIRRMANYNKNGMLNATNEDSYFSYFKTGNMAYYVDGAWAIHDAQYYDFEVGCCIMPSIAGNSDGATMMIGCNYLSVPIYAKKSDEAWKLIRLMLDSQIQTNIANGGERFPALKSASQTVYSDTDSEYYKDYFENYKTFTEYAVTKDVKGLPAFVMNKGKLSSLWSAAGGMLAKLVDSKNTTDPSILALDAQNAMMEEWNEG